MGEKLTAEQKRGRAEFAEVLAQQAATMVLRQLEANPPRNDDGDTFNERQIGDVVRSVKLAVWKALEYWM